MEENNELLVQKEKKTGGWKNAVIVILLIAVLGLGGYICYDKFIKDEPKQEVKQPEEKEEQQEEQKEEEQEPVKEEEQAKGEKVDVDVAKANEKLDVFNTALHFALDFNYSNGRMNNTYWFYPKNVKYNTELLDNETKKMDFAFATGILARINGIKYDSDENGNEVTGADGIKYDSFAKLYKDLYGNDLKKATKYASNEVREYTVKKDVIYGGFWSGYGPLGTILKFKSLEKLNDEYTLLADVITYEDDDEGYDEVMDYDDANKNDYPASIVSYKLKMVLTKTSGELYTIKSLQLVK